MDSRSSSAEHGTPARVLGVVRAAIVGWVLVFAGITLYLRETGALEPAAPDARAAFGAGVVAAAIGAVVLLWILRARRDAAQTRAARATLSILAWAVGEGSIVLAIVAVFVTGATDGLWVGAVTLLLALLLFPIPPDEH